MEDRIIKILVDGVAVDMEQVQIFWKDMLGNEHTGIISDYGQDMWDEGNGVAEAGESI